MTKAEIVTEIAKTTGIEKTSVLAVVEGLMTSIKDSLAHGENVYLRGFGSFIVKERKEKTARNISKNTTIFIPAHIIFLLSSLPQSSRRRWLSNMDHENENVIDVLTDNCECGSICHCDCECPFDYEKKELPEIFDESDIDRIIASLND